MTDPFPFTDPDDDDTRRPLRRVEHDPRPSARELELADRIFGRKDP